jgi:hypothetical protein
MRERVTVETEDAFAFVKGEFSDHDATVARWKWASIAIECLCANMQLYATD